MYRHLFFLLLLCCASLSLQGQSDINAVKDYYEKGNVLIGNLDGAGIPLLSKAIELSAASRDTSSQKWGMMALLSLSRYYMQTGCYDSSRNRYQQLLLRGQEYQDGYMIAKATMGIGIIADYQSDYETSVDKNREALRYFEQTKDSINIASALGNIGNSYIRLHYYDEAIPLFERGIQLATAKKEKRLLANLLSSLGRLYNNTKDRKKELAYKLQAYDLFRELNFTKGIATVTGNLGNYYEDANDLQTSLYYYRISLASSLAINDKGNIAIMYNNVADLYLKLGNMEQALACVDSALYFSERNGDRLALGDALIEKSVLLHAAGRYAEGVDLMDRYLGLRDSVYSERVQSKLADMHVRYETKKKEQQIALLSKENMLQQLGLRNKQLLVDNKQSEIIRQQQRLQIADLEFSGQRARLLQQSLLSQQQQDSIQGLKKQNRIQDLELANRELLISRKNLAMSLFALLLAALLLSGISLYRRVLRRRTELRKETEARLQLARMQAAHELQHEKLRIGKELHDNVGSHLTFINTYLEQLSEVYTGDTNITEARQVTLNTLRELRNAIWLIGQQEISVDAFVVKVREYLNVLPKGSMQAQLDFRGAGNVVMRPETATHLFRIIQEGVNNAVKYSGAKEVMISLDLKDSLQLTISDAGYGFDLAKVKRGNGCNNMAERASAIQASFSIQSEEGRGTQIRVTLPLTGPAA